MSEIKTSVANYKRASDLYYALVNIGNRSLEWNLPELGRAAGYTPAKLPANFGRLFAIVDRRFHLMRDAADERERDALAEDVISAAAFVAATLGLKFRVVYNPADVPAIDRAVSPAFSVEDDARAFLKGREGYLIYSYMPEVG